MNKENMRGNFPAVLSDRADRIVRKYREILQGKNPDVRVSLKIAASQLVERGWAAYLNRPEEDETLNSDLRGTH